MLESHWDLHWGDSCLLSADHGHAKSFEFVTVHNWNGIKASTCEICNATFTMKLLLKAHVRAIYDKLRPFQCSRCDSHIASIHEGLKP